MFREEGCAQPAHEHPHVRHVRPARPVRRHQPMRVPRVRDAGPHHLRDVVLDERNGRHRRLDRDKHHYAQLFRHMLASGSARTNHKACSSHSSLHLPFSMVRSDASADVPKRWVLRGRVSAATSRATCASTLSPYSSSESRAAGPGSGYSSDATWLYV
jgi:hypothetical protein